MSFVDFGAPPPAAAGAAAAFGADAAAAGAPLADWARAAARMSFVDLGALAGLGAAGAGGGAAAGAAAAGSAGSLGAASAGGVSGAPLGFADCARAAFRISSVESFFAIFSFTRNHERDGSGGRPAFECARRYPAGSACRIGRILSAIVSPVHTGERGAKRFPTSRNRAPSAFSALRTSPHVRCTNPIANRSRRDRLCSPQGRPKLARAGVTARAEDVSG
jgi:hypothetical protein